MDSCSVQALHGSPFAQARSSLAVLGCSQQDSQHNSTDARVDDSDALMASGVLKKATMGAAVARLGLVIARVFL